MLQSEITGRRHGRRRPVISLVERSSRCAIHIFTQTRFLEVTIDNTQEYGYNNDVLFYMEVTYENRH